MFAKLTGIIDYIDENYCIMDVVGVGYEIFVPSSYLGSIKVADKLSFHIQTIVKEDSISLYGFLNIQEKKTFNMLISVQGVGAKIALIMIAKLPLEKLYSAILLGDANLLKSIPGIGIKVAQRLINELGDKIKKIDNSTINIANNSSYQNTNLQDAKLALLGLGYSNLDIEKVFAAIGDFINQETSCENIIKLALNHIAKGL